ncbi:MAG: hypothetical protein NTW96_20435 [Planctomycetia bacterium]|nr:hypothetical protein [Planctomycetia bacterium]
MYDPTVGRFLEEDPIGFAAGDTNLYRYVHNSPTTRTDPSGLIELGNSSSGSLSVFPPRALSHLKTGIEDAD